MSHLFSLLSKKICAGRILNTRLVETNGNFVPIKYTFGGTEEFVLMKKGNTSRSRRRYSVLSFDKEINDGSWPSSKFEISKKNPSEKLVDCKSDKSTTPRAFLFFLLIVQFKVLPTQWQIFFPAFLDTITWREKLHNEHNKQVEFTHLRT